MFDSTQKSLDKSIKTLTKAIGLKSYRRLALNFLILSLNFIIIILYFALSQAKVTIIPNQEEIDYSLTIPIVNDLANEGEDSIFARVASVDLEHEQTFSLPDKKFAPAVAQGELAIHNTTKNRNQTLVTNTQFINDDGIILRLNETVKILPGQTITASARADEPGAESEISSGRFYIVKLPYLKDLIYGEVNKKFSGGFEEINYLSAGFFNDARAQIELAAKERALNLLQEQGYKPSGIEDLAITVTDFDASANPGDENIDELILKIKANINALDFDKSKALKISQDNLVSNISADKILVKFIEDSFVIGPNSDHTALQASLSARIQPKISAFALNKNDIIGKNRQEVEHYFRRITGVQDVRVKFSPFWVRRVPDLEDHVDIEIKTD